MSSRFLTAVGPTRLYPLTDRLISGLSHEEQVERLARLGATLIQLREKDLSAREFHSAAVAAVHSARKLNVKLIINDRVDIALAVGADGVHLGQDDLSPDAARRLLGPDSIIGISTHTVQQATVAARMPVDYVALGPIFPTRTKKAAEATVGLDGLRLVRQGIGDIPLVAIGGIDSLSKADVLEAGADCVSVISELWKPTAKIHR